jgi:hypothetical protein
MASRATYVQDGARNLFVASTQAGVATSTALSTTQTGFTLTNPFGSGKTLVLLQIRGALTTAPAAIATVVLAANVTPTAAAVTQTTPLTVRSANLGNGKAAVGLAASAVTLPAAPVVVRGLGGPVATGSVSQPQIVDDLEGALQVAPGCAVSINSLTTAISGVWSMVWEEIPEIA